MKIMTCMFMQHLKVTYLKENCNTLLGFVLKVTPLKPAKQDIQLGMEY